MRNSSSRFPYRFHTLTIGVTTAMLGGLTMFACLHSCTSTPSTTSATDTPAATEEDVAAAVPDLPPAQETAAPIATTSKSVPTESATPKPDPNCRFIPGLANGPVFLKKHGSVVSRFMNPCATSDGKEGIRTDTAWLAMGVPCTAGPGVIRYEGDYQIAKIVTFALTTDCPMAPSLAVLQAAAAKEFGLQSSSRLLAFNPLGVQFWEVTRTTDSDVGFTVELRSNQGLQSLWPKFLKGEPITVRLFGRENAWIPGDTMYSAEVEITPVAEARRFKTHVKDIHALTNEEFEQARSRCEALRPTRNCDAVFYQSNATKH